MARRWLTRGEADGATVGAAPCLRGLRAALLILPIAWFAACSGGNGSGTDGPPTSTPLADYSSEDTPQVSELRRIEKPEFTTRSELERYIAERHDRLRAFAQQSPQEELYAAVSFTRLMTRHEVTAFCAKYDIEPVYVEYRAGSVGGGFALITGISLADKEASLKAGGAIGPNGSLELTYLKGTTRAAEWVRAIDGEAAVALVYADDQLDRLEGLVSDDVYFMTPPSIFDDYQELMSPVP